MQTLQSSSVPPLPEKLPEKPVVGIVGLGLIGGSLGLDLRRQGYQVLGVSRRDRTCERAVERGAVDQASTDLSSLAEASLVVLCTPLDVLKETVQALLPHLQSETVLTDVGSVKQPIVEAIVPLWPRFVGGHPMAGTSEQGIEAAQLDLFQGRPYVITPSDDKTAIALVEQMAHDLGAQVYCCSAAEHDRAVAWISHLPVMVSTSLIQSCRQETSTTVLQLAQKLASSGFRDTSRVGGGNSELGLLMARYNREALLQSLAHYQRCLEQVKQVIEDENWSQLQQILEQSHQERTSYV